MFRITLLLACLASTAVFAQTTVYDMVDPANQNTSLLFGANSNARNVPYLMEFFNMGTVVLSNGSSLINIKINYDPLNDDLVTKKHDKDFIVDKTSVKEFTVYDAKTSTNFLFKKIEENNESFYAEVLATCAEFTLYKRNIIRMRDKDPQVGYGSDSFKGSSNFANYSKYFIIAKSGALYIVDRKNEEIKAFLTSLGGTENDLKQFQKLKAGPKDQANVSIYFQRFCK